MDSLIIEKKNLEIAELKASLTNPTCRYEIHITVAENSEKFQKACSFMGAKSIVIQAGEDLRPMSSWSDLVTHSYAFGMLQFQIQHLEAFDCKVIRAKVESDLTHPACRFKLPNQYFESHIQVKVQESELPNLQAFAKDLKLHMSANAFKVTGEEQIRMLTYRSYNDSPVEFQAKVQQFRHWISLKYPLVKGVECEFALYDTNIELDRKWIDGSR